jgi:hypothetical protein
VSEWGAVVRELTDPEAGLDRHTLEFMLAFTKKRSLMTTDRLSARPWLQMADKVQIWLEKAK